MKRSVPVITLLLLLLLFPGRRAAGEWAAELVDTPWSPPQFVAVDKQAQNFALFSRQSPLRQIESLPCATGQELGDKFKEGDLKTPEGVYFITRRRNAGLNYDLYGDLAFVLDFPNPMDVLRRKSGHGIWIHGRGHSITPFETQGCVALGTPDIHKVDPELAERMPVIIANSIHVDGPDAARLKEEGQAVVEATKAWAKAWQDRSDAFFAFHDPEKFAITEGQPFAAFRSHKERLFRALPWIQVTLFDVRAVPGPDYWVTYFIQVYRSPTLISQGVKRLYWQRNTDGRFRIVGMEYDEMPVTLADKSGIKAGPVNQAEVEPSTPRQDTVSEEETQVRHLVDAQQPILERMAQKAFHALKLTRPATPEDQAILEVAMDSGAKAKVATDALPKAPPAPAPLAVATHEQSPKIPSPAPVQPAPQPPIVTVAEAPAATPVPSAPQPAAAAPQTQKMAKPDPTAKIKTVLETWRAAWEKGQLDAYVACYATTAKQGTLTGKAAIRAQKKHLWTEKPPVRVDLSDVTITPRGKDFVVEGLQHYRDQAGNEDFGRKTLVLTPSGADYRIADETWTKTDARPTPPVAAAGTQLKSEPKPSPTVAQSPAAPAEKAVPQPKIATTTVGTTQAATTVETWRKAWEAGQLDDYVACYAPDVILGGRRDGTAALRAQKSRLWKSRPPRRVTVTDLAITPDANGFKAEFDQEYEGSDGVKRRGHKVLLLRPAGNGLVITSEIWSRS